MISQPGSLSTLHPPLVQFDFSNLTLCLATRSQSHGLQCYELRLQALWPGCGGIKHSVTMALILSLGQDCFSLVLVMEKSFSHLVHIWDDIAHQQSLLAQKMIVIRH